MQLAYKRWAIHLHRKEQFDIVSGGIARPWLVIHARTPDSNPRLFCLWRGGVWIRFIGHSRIVWRWDGSKRNRKWLWRARCSCGYKSDWRADEWKVALLSRWHIWRTECALDGLHVECKEKDK